MDNRDIAVIISMKVLRRVHSPSLGGGLGGGENHGSDINIFYVNYKDFFTAVFSEKANRNRF